MIKAFTKEYEGQANKIITQVTVYTSTGSVRVNALWDTGATVTCISTTLAKKLKLPAISKTKILTAGGVEDVDVYIAGLSIDDVIDMPKVEITSGNFSDQNIDIIIGMDVISYGDFAISKKNDQTIFSFRFPSQEAIDFSTSTSVNFNKATADNMRKFVQRKYR